MLYAYNRLYNKSSFYKLHNCMCLLFFVHAEHMNQSPTHTKRKPLISNYYQHISETEQMLTLNNYPMPSWPNNLQFVQHNHFPYMHTISLHVIPSVVALSLNNSFA